MPPPDHGTLALTGGQAMDEAAADGFATVAITWSQPEAAVMLAMFAFYGIPAYPVGRWHAAANPGVTVALQGIAIRVAPDAYDEALDLLAEVAERPAAVRPYLLGSAYLYRAMILFALFLLGLAALNGNPWFALIGASPLVLMMAAPPPTRTTAHFMLPKRRPPRLPDATGGEDQPATAS